MSVYSGFERLPYLDLKIWNIVPYKLKDLTTISAFKIAIKQWQPEKYP